MNDLIVSDGKNSKEVDFGLATTQKLNVEWPSPEQIAATTKRDTYPLTVRIDEVAYASLDLLAKQCNMSMSNFMNELINSYINQNKSSIRGFVFNRALNAHMERLATKLLHRSEIEIIREYHASVVKAILHWSRTELPKDEKSQNAFYQDFYQNLLATGNSQLVSMLSSSAHIYLELVSDDKKAVAESTKNYAPDELNQVGFADYVLTIPLSKWVVSYVILEQFLDKGRELFKHERDFLKHDKMTEISAVINKYDNAELIVNLIATLLLPEHFMEKDTDKPSEIFKERFNKRITEEKMQMSQIKLATTSFQKRFSRGKHDRL